jgi:hypothetical protein
LGVIVVAVSPDVASMLHRGDAAGSVEATSLLDLAAHLGGVLRPQHPGVVDPSMARWFVLEGLDDARAARAVEALRGHPAVEAAYVKPSDELPT